MLEVSWPQIEQEAQHQKRLQAERLGQQMPLFAVRGKHKSTGSLRSSPNGHCDGGSGAFRFNFPVSGPPPK